VLRVCSIASFANGTAIVKRSQESSASFWELLLPRLCDLASATKGQNNSLLVILGIDETTELPRQLDRLHPVTVQIHRLSDAAVEEYTSHHLGVPQDEVPLALKSFVADFVEGSPLACREILECLLLHEQMEVTKDESGAAISLGMSTDVEGIDLEGWAETSSMVADAVCLIESMEPVQNLVVKMMATFSGAASVADLAASLCSRYSGGAAPLDRLLLLKAVTDLTKRGILQAAEAPSEAEQSELFPIKCFRLASPLLRKVGLTLVSNAMRHSVKRQALMDRALTKFLPEKLKEAKVKKSVPHVPWYYQIEQKDIPHILKKSNDATHR
jgi:hypothetical protein